MRPNHFPKLSRDNPTGCCPQFNPMYWHDQDFTFDKKSFVRMFTRSFFYMPLNMGSMIKKAYDALTYAGVLDMSEFVILSRDLSPWRCEHLFSVTKPVKGMDNVALTGKYHAKVFEGAYKNAPTWIKAMKSDLVYLYYTTCPKCQKFYGKNYVVALAKV